MAEIDKKTSTCWTLIWSYLMKNYLKKIILVVTFLSECFQMSSTSRRRMQRWTERARTLAVFWTSCLSLNAFRRVQLPQKGRRDWSDELEHWQPTAILWNLFLNFFRWVQLPEERYRDWPTSWNAANLFLNRQFISEFFQTSSTSWRRIPRLTKWLDCCQTSGPNVYFWIF